MRFSIACSAVAVALANANNVGAQSDSAVATFLARARSATAKYADRGVAIADGYRAVGPETPAMGQHWVQPSLLVAGRLDPAAPQILEYVTAAGRAVLVGVAFAVPLTGRQSPPDAPVSAAQWHAHGGTVAEEVLGSSHAGMGAEMGERVAVLHAWVWASNPAGIFEAQNWSLPFLRAALTPPPHPPVAAAQALALGTGSLGFYEAELRTRVQPDSAEGAALALVLRASADTVARWSASRATGGSLTAADVDWLAAAWVRLRDRLAEAIGPAAATRLRALDGL